MWWLFQFETFLGWFVGTRIGPELGHPEIPLGCVLGWLILLEFYMTLAVVYKRVHAYTYYNHIYVYRYMLPVVLYCHCFNVHCYITYLHCYNVLTTPVGDKPAPSEILLPQLRGATSGSCSS